MSEKSKNNGFVSKMLIESYPDENYKGDAVGTYQLLMNPSEFKHQITVELSSSDSKGFATGKQPKSSGETYSFSFYLDGTGVAALKKGQPLDVAEEVDKFIGVVYKKKDSNTKPSYVKIYFCKNIYKCVLASLTINYTLMKNDGTPLRAKIDCSFNLARKEEADKKAEGKSTPKPPAPKEDPKAPVCCYYCCEERIDNATKADDDSLMYSKA